MNQQAIATAHALLWRHWQDGTVLDRLTAEVAPVDRPQGYAIQAAMETRSARALYGWKIAATSKAGQAHINVDGPLAGRLLAERAYSSGSVLRLGANRMRVVEPEFAFVMGRDLAPQPAPFDLDFVAAAVATLHPALEVPDSRFADFTVVGAAQLIADNACAHEFVLGPAAGDHWRGLDLSQHGVLARVEMPKQGTVLERQGQGSNVLGSPLIGLTWLANELSSLGITLKSGAVITTGTCMAPLAVAPGASVHADFGNLGSVALRFATS